MFTTLDGLRGVAAIAVVVYHFAGRTDLPFLLPRGYLAVDFFFVLSGFVVAHAYTRRLQMELGAGRFVAQRLIRLLPALVPGALLAAALELGRPDILDAVGHIRDTVLATVLACLAIPLPFSTSLEQTIFPINGPVWSLFFEIVANGVFLVVAKSRSVWGCSAALVTIGAIGLVIFAYGAGRMDVGPALTNWPGGFPRVFFSFFLGVLLSGMQTWMPPGRVAARWIWVFPAVLLVAFAVPQFGSQMDVFVDLGFVFLVFPVLVRKAANVEQLPSVDRASNVLGKLSYPLYAVHYPIVRAIGFIVLRHPMPLLARLGIVGVSVAVVTTAAWIMSRFYDEPVRRALTRRLLPVTTMSRPAIRVSVHTDRPGQIGVRSSRFRTCFVELFPHER